MTKTKLIEEIKSKILERIAFEDKFLVMYLEDEKISDYVVGKCSAFMDGLEYALEIIDEVVEETV